MKHRSFSVNVSHEETEAIEIAPGIYWVGSPLANDPFQCHVYLILAGEQSVLIDPGSRLTWDITYEKIKKIIPFENIKYFICHHQDPDIASCLPSLDSLILREDAVIITHWRTKALLKHYDLKNLRFWLVDEHNWELSLPERKLHFIFTPYAHFPGAICTYDSQSGTLFSSDLFGGFTNKFQLFAEDESHFENIKPFHEHYIPGKDILDFAIQNMRRFDIEMIAPQHGSIIPPHLVNFMMDQLSHLDCGIYLFAKENTDIKKLSSLNKTLRDITTTMLLFRDFRDIAGKLHEIVLRVLPVMRMDFFSLTDTDEIMYLSSINNYNPLMELIPQIPLMLGKDHREWIAYQNNFSSSKKENEIVADSFILHYQKENRPEIEIPLFSPENGRIRSLAVLYLQSSQIERDHIEQVIEQIRMPLQVALEREVIYRSIEMQRQKAYDRSIRDPLTGLFNRFYLNDILKRQCEIHDRGAGSFLSAVMFDLDHFKRINDEFGHAAGDEALKIVAGIVMSHIRTADVPVRFGGDEILVLLIGADHEDTNNFAKRIQTLVCSTGMKLSIDKEITLTISAGFSTRKHGEPVESFLQRADRALIKAKNSGRNCVISGDCEI